MNETCETCIHSHRPEPTDMLANQLFCRRYPPRFSRTYLVSPFPIVLYDDYCGEHTK